MKTKQIHILCNEDNSQEEMKAVAVGASSSVLRCNSMLNDPFISNVNRKEDSVLMRCREMFSFLPCEHTNPLRDLAATA